MPNGARESPHKQLAKDLEHFFPIPLIFFLKWFLLQDLTWSTGPLAYKLQSQTWYVESGVIVPLLWGYLDSCKRS